MAPELVDTDSNHPCTEPQVEMSRLCTWVIGVCIYQFRSHIPKFVCQHLDPAAKDLISESVIQLPNPKVTEGYVPSTLSKLHVGNEETLGDLEELQQTCHALAKLQDSLPNDKGPLSSNTAVRHDVSSLPPEEVALLYVSTPHHLQVGDGRMYADTSWYMSHKNFEEPNHLEARCQASTITQYDHIPDVPLGSSQQLLNSLGMV